MTPKELWIFFHIFNSIPKPSLIECLALFQGKVAFFADFRFVASPSLSKEKEYTTPVVHHRDPSSLGLSPDPEVTDPERRKLIN